MGFDRSPVSAVPASGDSLDPGWLPKRDRREGRGEGPALLTQNAYGRAALIVLALVAVAVWFLPAYYTGLLTLIGIYSLVTIGLNLFMGYAGQVSLGQAAFVGIGAYTSAVLAVYLHVTPWLGAAGGAGVGAPGAGA